MIKVHTNKDGITKKHKIVIIGDSHLRGQAKKVKNHLNKNFEVISLVKPGAGVEILVNSANNDIMNLTKIDAVVLRGGSNDVSKNNTNVALQHISNVVKVNKNTNIILLNASHSHDMMESSCVNNETRLFTSKLMKHVKTFNYTTVLKINSNWELFTCHGSASQWARERKDL